MIGLALLYQNLILFNHTVKTSHSLVKEFIVILDSTDDLSHSSSVKFVVILEIFQYFSAALPDVTHSCTGFSQLEFQGNNELN
jgi:hypothetical protein